MFVATAVAIAEVGSDLHMLQRNNHLKHTFPAFYYAPNLFPKIFHLAEGTEYSRPLSFGWKRQPEHR